MNLKRFLLLIIMYSAIGITIGILVILFDIELETSVLIFGFILIMVFYIGYLIYISLLTKNINLVDKYINRKGKHYPYYATLLALVIKQFDEAEKHMDKLGAKYSQAIISFKASIKIEKNEIDEAEKTIEKIKNDYYRNYYSALLALAKGNLQLFEQYKSNVKVKTLQYSLDAEAAYIKGNYEEAEKYGDLAINNSKGLQRWILVKSLEYQKNNSNRQSYF